MARLEPLAQNANPGWEDTVEFGEKHLTRHGWRIGKHRA